MEVSINGSRFKVDSLQEAREAWIAYRDFTGIGASGMKRNDGKVYEGGKVIARVSYNGRLWTPEPFPKCMEII